ncbi:Hypothetical predicted protein [Olea europaea subsp. europaea]|uniref:Uncharacterized protein n=1 Tax=Olea europaea subsp. europaea TaxID=158383 RepID=A0A8S0QS42_OLEEU|nr:Hypothetical predicted protein [Olea europaea subsp. europaea]
MARSLPLVAIKRWVTKRFLFPSTVLKNLLSSGNCYIALITTYSDGSNLNRSTTAAQKVSQKHILHMETYKEFSTRITLRVSADSTSNRLELNMARSLPLVAIKRWVTKRFLFPSTVLKNLLSGGNSYIALITTYSDGSNLNRSTAAAQKVS